MNWDPLLKLIAVPAEAGRVVTDVTLFFAEKLFELINQELASDIAVYRYNLQRKAISEADAEQAEAEKKIAQAAQEANEATIRKLPAVKRARVCQEEALAKKTLAEADKAGAEAEAIKITSRAEAVAKVFNALANFKKEGGELFLDFEEIKGILKDPTQLLEMEEDDAAARK